MRRSFKIAFLIVTVALIYGIVALSVDVLRIKAALDHLYWISKNTHSGGVRIAIGFVEAELRQKLTILTALAVVMSVLIASELIIIRFGKEKVKT